MSGGGTDSSRPTASVAADRCVAVYSAAVVVVVVVVD